MTPYQVRKRIREIKASLAANDHEVACSERYDLFRDVLAAIANGHVGAASLAKTALKADKLDVKQW